MSNELSKEQIEALRALILPDWQKRSTSDEIVIGHLNALCDLALRALSPSPEREGQSVQDIINELASIADACADLSQNERRPDSDQVMGWDNAKLTLGTLRNARRLRDSPRPEHVRAEGEMR